MLCVCVGFNNYRFLRMEFQGCDAVSLMYFVFFFPVFMRTTDPKKQRHIKSCSHKDILYIHPHLLTRGKSNFSLHGYLLPSRFVSNFYFEAFSAQHTCTQIEKFQLYKLCFPKHYINTLMCKQKAVFACVVLLYV